MKNVPNEIYLNTGCLDDTDADFKSYSETGEVFWFEDRQAANDIKYIRAEAVKEIVKQLSVSHPYLQKEIQALLNLCK